MDWLTITVGCAIIIGSLGAIFRSQKQYRSSPSNQNARLAELEAGAPEKYFEERRELEAYPPKFDLANRTIRRLGLFSLILGCALVMWALVG